MIHNPIHIIDNIYCSFNYIDNLFVPSNGINGYNTLTLADVGKTISYLARDTNDAHVDRWEIGIGEINDTHGFISVKRLQVIASSYHNQEVDFTEVSNSSLCEIGRAHV